MLFCPTHRGRVHPWVGRWLTFELFLGPVHKYLSNQRWTLLHAQSMWRLASPNWEVFGLELGLGGLELAHYTIETRRSLGGTPTNFPVKPCLPSGRSVGRTGTTAGRNPLIRLLSITPSVPQGSVCTWNQAVLLLEPYVWDNLIRPLHFGQHPQPTPQCVGKKWRAS